MNESKGMIGLKQYVAIFLIVIGTKITDDKPAMLYEALLNSAWMMPIISGLVVTIPIYLLIVVIRSYEHNNLFKIFVHLFGKHLGKIIIFVLWVLLSLKLITESGVYTTIIEMKYFPKTPTLAIYALLMIVSAYGAKRGIEHIGSVSYLVIYAAKFSLFISLVLSISHGQVEFMYPIFGPGIWEIIKGSVLKISIFIDVLYLCFLIPYMKNVKEFSKGTWFALTFIIIEFSILLLAFVFLFDYESIKLLNFPYHEVIRFIYIGFLTNIEFFFLPFWLITVFIRFSVHLYINAMMFGNLFNVKHFEYIIPTLATIVIFIGIMPNNPAFTLYDFGVNLFHIFSPILIFLPCLLWILAKFKGDLKNG